MSSNPPGPCFSFTDLKAFSFHSDLGPASPAQSANSNHGLKQSKMADYFSEAGVNFAFQFRKTGVLPSSSRKDDGVEKQQKDNLAPPPGAKFQDMKSSGHTIDLAEQTEQAKIPEPATCEEPVEKATSSGSQASGGHTINIEKEQQEQTKVHEPEPPACEKEQQEQTKVHEPEPPACEKEQQEQTKVQRQEREPPLCEEVVGQKMSFGSPGGSVQPDADSLASIETLLCVADPWCRLLVTGEKTWELRSYSTNKRH